MLVCGYLDVIGFYFDMVLICLMFVGCKEEKNIY